MARCYDTHTYETSTAILCLSQSPGLLMLVTHEEPQVSLETADDHSHFSACIRRLDHRQRQTPS